jgi:hypothetical protein
MKQIKNIIFIGLIINLIISGVVLTGCIEDDKQNNNQIANVYLKCEPIVVISGTNYSSAQNYVPYEEIHKKIAENYSGKNLSLELRNLFIQNILNKTNELGENSTILFEAIKITYYNWSERPNKVPCYAEKAFYNNESVWVLAFNRANGFDDGLGHYELYFISIPTITIQYQTGCNSTAIVYWEECD